MQCLPVVTVSLLLAQTFPAEYKTTDTEVADRLKYWMRQHSEDHDNALNFTGDVAQLAYGTPGRVYKAMAESARVSALQTALPLLKSIAMSTTLHKAQDALIAQRYGAVNHGLQVSAAADPVKRMSEMMQGAQKNPKLYQDPKWMAEFQRVQSAMSGSDPKKGGSGVSSIMLRGDATRYTRDLKQLIGDVRNQISSADPKHAKCYEDALLLADINADMFRLRSAKCYFETMGQTVNEAGLDKERKEIAQLLYNEKCAKGILKAALTQFVQSAGTVDFAAATASKGTKTVFVNPVHEKQTPMWKMIYRNGKAPTDAAVAFAKSWLAEL
jgi:hypothetical protein